LGSTLRNADCSTRRVLCSLPSRLIPRPSNNVRSSTSQQAPPRDRPKRRHQGPQAAGTARSRST
jgi:hypothetical protein